MDDLAYADGEHSIFDISKKIGKNINSVFSEVVILKKHKSITTQHIKE